MAKSAGGGGRRGRGRSFVAASPGSAADVLRQRAAFRATQPPPREVNIASRLEFGKTDFSPRAKLAERGLNAKASRSQRRNNITLVEFNL